MHQIDKFNKKFWNTLSGQDVATSHKFVCQKVMIKHAAEHQNRLVICKIASTLWMHGQSLVRGHAPLPTTPQYVAASIT